MRVVRSCSSSDESILDKLILCSIPGGPIALGGGEGDHDSEYGSCDGERVDTVDEPFKTGMRGASDEDRLSCRTTFASSKPLAPRRSAARTRLAASMSLQLSSVSARLLAGFIADKARRHTQVRLPALSLHLQPSISR